MNSNIKKLIPNLSAYAATYGIYQLSSYVFKNHKKKYKEVLTSINEILDTFPNEQDTVFSSAKKAGSLSLKTIFKEYKNITEFLRHFEETKSEFKPATDHMFINVFFDQILSRGIALKQEYYTSIGIKDENKTTVYCYEFSRNRKLYILEEKGFFGPYTLPTFLANFKYQELIKDVFETYNGNVYVSYNDKDGKISFNELKHETLIENKIYNPKLTENIVTELQKFINMDLQRSYLLIGEPGTGKSTTCYQIAKAITNNCIKLDSSILKIFSSDTAEMLVNYSGAKVIVIDDIDRITADQVSLNKLLYCIESIKTFKLKPVLLATANKADNMDTALFRPGRFDKIITFDLPTEHYRTEFFMEEMKGLSAQEIEILSKETDKFSHAHLKEITKQYNAGIKFEEILEDIKTRKAFMFSVKITETPASPNKSEAPAPAKEVK